jgi:hypothetical protein
VSPKSGEKRHDRTTNDVLKKSFGMRPFLEKKREKAFRKPFGKDLRKPLCAGILRKWF